MVGGGLGGDMDCLLLVRTFSFILRLVLSHQQSCAPFSSIEFCCIHPSSRQLFVSWSCLLVELLALLASVGVLDTDYHATHIWSVI